MLPMLAITLFFGEVETLRKLEWTLGGIAALVASCLGGLGMSYFSFALRAVISATSFSVIGNVCKVLTILVNLLMWDNHASAPLLLASNACRLGMPLNCTRLYSSPSICISLVSILHHRFMSTYACKQSSSPARYQLSICVRSCSGENLAGIRFGIWWNRVTDFDYSCMV